MTPSASPTPRWLARLLRSVRRIFPRTRHPKSGLLFFKIGSTVFPKTAYCFRQSGLPFFLRQQYQVVKRQQPAQEADGAVLLNVPCEMEWHFHKPLTYSEINGLKCHLALSITVFPYITA